MKNVGMMVRLLAVVSLLALGALALTGCGDEPKKDTVSTDQSQPTAGTDSGTKQFDSGETIGKAGKVVVNSDADFSANQQAVIERIGEFGDATADQDYKKLCNGLLSKAARKIGGDCVGTFSKTGKQLKDFKITVNSVKITEDGKNAVAKVNVSSNMNKTPTPQDLSLVKEDGEWRIQILGQ
jgi:outer membrane murein-binding lipoprotein Lpp